MRRDSFFNSHIKVQFCPADLQNCFSFYCKFGHFQLMGFCLLILNLYFNILMWQIPYYSYLTELNNWIYVWRVIL